MQLAHGISFESLYTRSGLAALDARFVDELRQTDTALFNRLATARANPDALADKDHSQLIIDLGPHAEEFVASLFGIRAEVTALKQKHFALAPLYSCKRLFVQRRALKAVKEEEAKTFDGEALWTQLKCTDELSFARAVMAWLDAETDHKDQLESAARYAAWAVYSPAGRDKHKNGVLFKTPRKLDPQRLIEVETEIKNGVTVLKLPHHHLRHREGFALTDDGGTLAKALDETNYCIWCHNQEKDSCSKGFRIQDPGSRGKSLPESRILNPESSFKTNSLNITLAGCPLEEKISEMNFLKSEGIPIGALAAVVIDNPMCAGTGHRICNDCMKSCIYQKQEPVNIPQAETRTLKDILELPYGFEIYSLLTRWNPLNIHRPIPREATGKKVLIAGLGPAGYTLAHHLMNDGHTVVGIDGLKIEPLSAVISGVTPLGEPVSFTPIKDIGSLREPLESRVLAGFGGVAEYGITVRWDKNYLKIIRLLLERRRQFTMIGGVRFGSQITIDSAWELGFDHIALCMGAGKPTILDIPNGLARGVRAASDFLMALQLTGAAKTDSIANLQLRLPVVVIGGGLTAIDTATESLAYYPLQVEKFLARHEALAIEKGEAAVQKNWSDEEKIIANEFIAHARALRATPAPQRLALLKSWGGATIAYRKKLSDSPSYRLNHEEVEKALEEGIVFAEDLEPVSIEVDAFNHAKEIKFKSVTPHSLRGPENQIPSSDGVTMPAKTILYAAGTSPNTVLQREDPTHVTLHGKYFQAADETGAVVVPEKNVKPASPRVLMNIDSSSRAISFFGDLHPSFAGNVVKAMASAKQGYPVVSRVLEKRVASGQWPVASDFLAAINRQLRATIHDVIRLTPTIVEVIVEAPLAAKTFQPGQFYRLQNFEANASKIGHESRVMGQEAPTTHDSRLMTTLAMEGLALTGASADKEKGLLSTIILEMGGSSDLCAHLKKGEPVVLMGPTGTPTHIPQSETVLLAGGGLGNAVLFSMGKAMRDKGCKVLYFAGYRRAQDRYKVEDIEAAADAVVWCCDETALSKNRPQDASFHGNIIAAMQAHADRLREVDRIIAIGSDGMMAAVARARHTTLKPYLKPGHFAIGSINSPMQCMMKEICAQCLQKQIDPQTGKETYVFSCFNQDQELDRVSFPDLQARLKQNSVQEKLTAQWIDRCLKKHGLRLNAA